MSKHLNSFWTRIILKKTTTPKSKQKKSAFRISKVTLTLNYTTIENRMILHQYFFWLDGCFDSNHTNNTQLCNVNTYAVCFCHSFFSSFIPFIIVYIIYRDCELTGWKSGMLHHVCNTYVFNSMFFSMNINSRRGLLLLHSPKTTIIFGDDHI